MKVRMMIPHTYDVTTLKVDLGVRYWKDGEINGEDDISYEEQKAGEAPRMPFAEKMDRVTGATPHGAYRLRMFIDLNTHSVIGWPKGTTAKLHYKICDDGEYTIFDKDGNEIACVQSYVPEFLGEYGDYFIMDIDQDGEIANFNPTSYDIEDMVSGGFYNE